MENGNHHEENVPEENHAPQKKHVPFLNADFAFIAITATVTYSYAMVCAIAML